MVEHHRLGMRGDGRKARTVLAHCVECCSRTSGYVCDIVIEGVTGVVVPRRDAGALADGVRTALAEGTSFGEAARRHCLANLEIDAVAGTWESVLATIMHRESHATRP
jgi:glycosyltransferase involved in cell wall biosynthesis